jgi:hypothetical protein
MYAALLLPKWVIDEHAITLATWGLVVATLLLVLDSWKKGTEQRERWKREDEAAAELRKPKYRCGVEVNPKDKTLSFWLANLGTTGLYLDSVFIRRCEGQEAIMTANTATIRLAVNLIAAPGNQVHFTVPEGLLNNREPNPFALRGDHEIWARVSDASSTFETEKLISYVLAKNSQVLNFNIGNGQARYVSCPNASCKEQVVGLLPPTGASTERELIMEYIGPAERDLLASCPNHASSRLTWMGGQNA